MSAVGTASMEAGSTKMRLGKQVRAGLFRDLKQALSGVETVVIAKVEKVSTQDINKLRISLRGIESNFLVVKNSLCRLTFKERGWTDLDKFLQGTCGVAPIRGEVTTAAKLLATFSKDHEGFVIQGGVLQGQPIPAKELAALAKLPSREVLLSQVAGILQLPIRNLAVVLQASIRSFVLTMEALRQKKEKEEPKAQAAAKEEPKAQAPAEAEAPKEPVVNEEKKEEPPKEEPKA